MADGSVQKSTEQLRTTTNLGINTVNVVIASLLSSESSPRLTYNQIVVQLFRVSFDSNLLNAITVSCMP